ncbi:unnamed protein product [Ostreobium quekettii]|uniref:Peptidase S1 domain-containing protein n=1 Tax=Ostreobium quekettii TaxID=121088 RepID=A0A8S1IV79_9CHLO|nr:unnamed protein product [Ostreobium quekettii]
MVSAKGWVHCRSDLMRCPVDTIQPLDPATQVSVPKEIITHTNFTGEVQGGYDIAMIRLKEPTEKTPISLPPISQNGPRLGVGNILVALGWGLVPDALPPERLQEAGELLFVPNDVCNGFWDDRIDGTMMCAAGTGEFRGQGTCKGDSGGPLLIANAPGSNTSNGRPQLDILVGITSFGEKDCETGSKPGVYAQVAAFHLWIEEIIETDGAAAKVTPTPAATLIEATPSASTSPQDASTTPSTQGDPQESLRLWTAAATGSVRNAEDALDKGADVNFTSGALGDAPLHLAATSGNLEMVQVLIAAGADVNQGRSSDRFTPLVSASKAGHHKVVRALVEANADVELASKAGHTPLMWASFGSHPQVVETLLDARADPNSAVNLQKRPALHFVYQVAAASSDRITNMLLDAGADIDWQDTEKYTPLMAATYFGNPGVANVLVVRGADVSLGDLGGNTAADIICACLSQNACPNGRCKSGGEEAQIEALFK